MKTARKQAPQNSRWPVVMFASSAPLLFVCWLIFVGTFEMWEMLAGVAAALLGSTALCVVERADQSHFKPRLIDWLQIAYVPWLLVQGTYDIVLVSLRDLFGGRSVASAFRVTRFDAGSPDNPQDTGRRVLAVAYTTMSPTSVVLGINTRGDRLLFHDIGNSGVSRMTQNLGAQA